MNGKAVLELSGLQGSVYLPLKIPTPLAPGLNRVEIRSCPKSGSGSFAAVVRDAKGRLLEVTEAIRSYKRALEIMPDFPLISELHTGLRLAERERERERAIEREPERSGES